MWVSLFFFMWAFYGQPCPSCTYRFGDFGQNLAVILLILIPRRLISFWLPELSSTTVKFFEDKIFSWARFKKSTPLLRIILCTSLNSNMKKSSIDIFWIAYAWPQKGGKEYEFPLQKSPCTPLVILFWKTRRLIYFGLLELDSTIFTHSNFSQRATTFLGGKIYPLTTEILVYVPSFWHGKLIDWYILDCLSLTWP